MVKRIHLRQWRMVKGVPYGTLLWFDECKEMPELFQIPVESQRERPAPLDSEGEVDQIDIPLSVSASKKDAQDARNRE